MSSWSKLANGLAKVQRELQKAYYSILLDGKYSITLKSPLINDKLNFNIIFRILDVYFFHKLNTHSTHTLHVYIHVPNLTPDIFNII